MRRRRSIGAEVVEDGVSFRVWAPAHEAVAVVIGERNIPLLREPGGYFSGLVPDASAGTRYSFRLGDQTFPDPASRFQPEGPHAPSQVVDPTTFPWTDHAWRAPSQKGLVLYEIHVGTFTREGTFGAAIDELARLADIGVNMIEVMPLAEFAGNFGWGYDGVDLWAPMHTYGTPDDFRRFVDAAHAQQLAVILDVVYNHLGPDGCYLAQFSPSYFTKKYENDWGEAIDFESEPAVREYFVENAAYWIDEFHLDGLRLDATQSISDASEKHVIREITDAARAAAGERTIFLVAENEPQDSRLLRELGVDAMWNDDWHHASNVALTGKAEAYYTDYRGTAQEFVSMAKLGFLFQGQRYKWQRQRRGTPSHDIAPERLVCYIENHDQVANSAHGWRVDRITSPGRHRAMTALLLLQPQTPMLFQGQEFGATPPFVYFADHDRELAQLVANGRREFLAQFPSIDASHVPPPDARATFAMCKLDHSQRNRELEAMHRSLLALRREHPFAEQRNDWLHGAVLSEQCLVLRWFCGDDRLLLVNLGRQFDLDPAPEPLLAAKHGWSLLWSSEDPAFGGGGTADVETEEDGWRIPGEAAVVLRPRPTRVASDSPRPRG
jgi:maltooligosyltrehalose trehalohydrolase